MTVFNNGRIGLIRVGITVWDVSDFVREVRADQGRSGKSRWSGMVRLVLVRPGLFKNNQDWPGSV